MKIAIIDYESGNLRSAVKSFERAAREAELDTQITLINRAEDVRAADKIVLPGVGAYAECRKTLGAVPGMIEALNEMVIEKARPFLGICVGLQLMSTRGLEKEVTAGLNWIAGDVRLLEPDDPGLKVPQMGWNTINLEQPHPLLDDIETGPDGKHAYFVHSYHFVPKNSDHIIATADYGGAVTAILAKDNMIGTQFHPEKSQTLGLQLITNFLKWNI